MWIRKALAHPLTKGFDIDDPCTTNLRKQIIEEKLFLKKLYIDWYRLINASLPHNLKYIIEIGSGAGFLKEFIPVLITSELFSCTGIDTVLNGLALPFSCSSLDSIVFIDVLHHIPDPKQFLREAARCVKPKGNLVMIEPWVTPWSKFVYTRLHYEPFDCNVTKWELESSGPLSSANGAIPYIIFKRDREQFEKEFPTWKIKSIHPIMPFLYLLSGGVSMRSLMPGWSYKFWRNIERSLNPFMNQFAMFCRIVLERTDFEG